MFASPFGDGFAIPNNERQLLMIKFRNILFEFNENEANKNLNDYVPMKMKSFQII